MPNNKVRDEVLVEYQKAQDSAEHYNTMTWTLMSIGIGFSLLLLKIVLFDIPEREPHLLGNNFLSAAILTLGSMTLTYFGFLIDGATEKKLWKYEVCKEIEKMNNGFIGQNLGTQVLPLTKSLWGKSFFNTTKMLILSGFLCLGLGLISERNNAFDQTLIILSAVGSLAVFVLNIVTLIFPRKMTYETTKKEITKIRLNK